MLLAGGLGLGPPVALIALVTIIPVLSRATAGLVAVERSYRELGRLLDLPAWVQFERVGLPFVLPAIFAGLRVESTHAVTAAVVC